MKALIIIPLLFSMFTAKGQVVDTVQSADSTQYADEQQQVEPESEQDRLEQEQLQQERRQRLEKLEARRLVQRGIDSIERPGLRDSLGIDEGKVTALFAIRQGFFEQSDSIYSDPYQDFESKQAQVRILRKETDNAYRALLGKTLYLRYTEMITRESRKKLRGKWDTNILPLTLEPI